MRNGFWFKSNIFEIAAGEDEETNPERYGKSLGIWLCSKFIERGYSEAELVAEDWGWCVVCSRGEVFLWVGCGSINVERSRADYDLEKPPKGHEVVWHFFPQAEISILNPKAYLKKLFGKLRIEEQLNKLEHELELVISSESSIKLCSEHTIKCVTSRCSTAPALRACAGQFLSRGFVVLLRKNIPQNHNLKTAAELGVKEARYELRGKKARRRANRTKTE